MSDMLEKEPWYVEETLGVAKVQIRVQSTVAGRLSHVLRLHPPVQPNHETRNNRIGCATIAPGKWMLTGPRDDIRLAMAQIGEAFTTEACLAVDISAGCFVATISGPHAIKLLSSYSPMDIHPKRFPTGAATYTRLGDLRIFITRIGELPTFRLIIDQSMRGYFHHLVDLIQAN